MQSLTVVLPAYKEEKTIGRVIDEIRSLPIKCDILVVYTPSPDNTYNAASCKGVEVAIQTERGKGNAIRFGFGLVKTPYVVMMDSDYTYPAGWIILIDLALRYYGYDIVICERKWRSPGSMPTLNLLGNKGLSILASLLFRKRVRDLCSGMWGFRKEVLDKFNLVSKGFTLEADLFVNAVRNKCSIAQIPSFYRPRPDGDKPKLKLSDGFKIGWFLIEGRFR